MDKISHKLKKQTFCLISLGKYTELKTNNLNSITKSHILEDHFCLTGHKMMQVVHVGWNMYALPYSEM